MIGISVNTLTHIALGLSNRYVVKPSAVAMRYIAAKKLMIHPIFAICLSFGCLVTLRTQSSLAQFH